MILRKLFLIKIVSLFFLLVLTPKDSRSQGCSDAGFCSIHSLKPSGLEDEKFKNNLSIGLAYGKSDNDINIINPYLEYTREVSSIFSFSGKIIFSSINGDLANTNGLSDAFVNGIYKVIPGTAVTLGVKIPFNDGNMTSGNYILPMSYQISLGTYDVIAGINHSHKNFGFSAAIQYPISQNKNKFFPSRPADNIFQATNNYKRAGDILARITYSFNPANSKFTITPGLLPVYHLSNDKYTDAFGNEKEIDGSQGLTLNANLFLNYSINSGNAIEFSFGAPLKSRTSRPDGLTRKFVAALEYKILF